MKKYHLYSFANPAYLPNKSSKIDKIKYSGYDGAIGSPSFEHFVHHSKISRQNNDEYQNELLNNDEYQNELLNNDEYQNELLNNDEYQNELLNNDEYQNELLNNDEYQNE